MQDRDAELAVRVDVGVRDGDQETELGRLVRVFVREHHLGPEVAPVEGAVGVDDHEAEPPLEDVEGRRLVLFAPGKQGSAKIRVIDDISSTAPDEAIPMGQTGNKRMQWGQERTSSK